MTDAAGQRAGESLGARAAGVVMAIAVWLLVGAGLSVVVGWMVATLTPLRVTSPAPFASAPTSLALPAGFTLLEVSGRFEFGMGSWILDAEESSGANVAADPLGVPAAKRLSVQHWEFGLPWRAVSMRVSSTAGAPAEWRGGLRTGLGIGRISTNGVRRLPMLPVIPGLIEDAAFWGGIAWVIALALGVVRRRARGKRGECRWCRYPVAGEPVCTECGRRIPAPMTSRRRRLEGLAVRLCASAALGALTTIGVAWRIASRTGWESTVRRSFDDTPRGILLDGTTWDAQTQQAPGAEYVCFVQQGPVGWLVDPEDARLRNQWVMISVPEWAAPLAPKRWALRDNPRDYEWSVGYAGYGWPARAMVWERSGAMTLSSQDIPSRAIVLTPLRTAKISAGAKAKLPAPAVGIVPGLPLRALPLGILWKGFALNTACFGGAWLVALVSANALAGAVRRRRGSSVAMTAPPS